MALTSRDETDLLLPLFHSAQEEAPFSTFLERLRRRVGVISASITIRPRLEHEAALFFVGPDLRKMALNLQLDELNLIHRIRYDRLRPNRVYSGDEIDDYDPASRARYLRDMRKIGLADERVVRLLDDDPLSAWLAISSERACSAADSALLSNLAPYVAAAVRNFVRAEQQAQATLLNAQCLQRSRGGWILFDSLARIIALAPPTQAILTKAFGHDVILGQRLRELGPSVERALAQAAAEFGQQPHGASASTASSDETPPDNEAPDGGTQAVPPCDKTILLMAEPRLEAILSRPPASLSTMLDTPAMLATCHAPRRHVTGGARHLARLHNLPPREAELALHLADGLSLAEAGTTMGLTIETTRNYSKRLFAKLGVRGQAELVRAVYESCAVLD